jgi:hypothetical protein
LLAVSCCKLNPPRPTTYLSLGFLFFVGFLALQASISCFLF